MEPSDWFAGDEGEGLRELDELRRLPLPDSGWWVRQEELVDVVSLWPGFMGAGWFSLSLCVPALEGLGYRLDVVACASVVGSSTVRLLSARLAFVTFQRLL